MANHSLLGQLFIRAFVSILVSGAIFQQTAEADCEFPSEIQTNLTGRKWTRDWQFRVKDQFTEFPVKIEVVHDVLRIISTDRNVTSGSRICLQVVNETKYLVKHEESSGRSTGQIKYSCLEFVFRSSNVFQMRASVPGDSMDASVVCEDSVMLLDKWLIVDKARLGMDGHHSVCPLEGGFSITVYDKSRGEGVCDAWRGEIRMESECSSGEGLTFYFRQQRCVPEGMYMYATQRTVCLSTWNEGDSTFAIIRHDMTQHTWLLRVPKVRQSTFTTHLFKDLFADTENQITETNRYLRFDTLVDTPSHNDDEDDLSRLCRDEYEICTKLKAPCASDPLNLVSACPKTCGICNKTTVNLCNLNPNWTGSWSDSASAGKLKRTVDINSTTLTVYSGADGRGELSYRCVRWSSSASVPSKPAAFDDVMLLTEYSNGCLPKYTCSRVIKQTSSILYIELSKSMHGPLINSSNNWISRCDGFSFTQQTTGDHLLLHATNGSTEPVQCHLPSVAMEAFQMRLRNGTECLGNLTERDSGSGIDINLNDCAASDTQLPLQSFTCLESYTVGTTSDRFIITKSVLGASTDLYCWLFPKNQFPILYLTDGAHCHLALSPNARLTPHQYLMQGMPVRRTRKVTSTLPSTKVSLDNVTQMPLDDVTQTSYWPTTSNNSNTPGAVETTTTAVNILVKSPIVIGIVVVIAVVVLAVVLTVLFCKCCK